LHHILKFFLFVVLFPLIVNGALASHHKVAAEHPKLQQIIQVLPKELNSWLGNGVV